MIPLLPFESRVDESIKIIVIVKDIVEPVDLNIKVLKIILSDGREIIPLQYHVKNYVSGDKTFKPEELLHLDEEVELLIDYDISKKGIKSFDLSLDGFFVGKKQKITLLKFSEYIGTIFSLGP